MQIRTHLTVQHAKLGLKDYMGFEGQKKKKHVF